MNRIAALLSFFRSRVLTVWLVGIFILYYLTVAVWSKEAFVVVITGLSHGILLRTLFVLLFLNVLARTTGRIRRELERSKARVLLRMPLYAAVLLFLCMFFMSLNTRQSVWMIRGEGDPVDFPWERGSLRIVEVTSALKQRAVRKEGSRIFDHEPSLTVVNPSGQRYRIDAFPPTKVGRTYLHVLNFGIGPDIELQREGRTIFRSFVALRLTPFGAVDVFQPPGLPFRFHLTILPNGVRPVEKELEREYDLSRPRYRVEVMRGDSVIAQGETERMLRFGDDMAIRFEKPSDWVLLEAVYDPFYPGYVASLLLLLAGGLLYPVSFLVGRKTLAEDDTQQG